MRVMTYNIRGGLGTDGRRDIRRIAGVVRAWEPDVVCFQEVHQRLPWSGFADQPRRLRSLLGRAFVFQANVRYLFGVGGYGLGIATAYPVLRVVRCHLPSHGERRGVLQVEMGTPAGPLTVLCTHWGLKREERARQAAKMGEWLGRVERPVVVCGDLNETPETDAVQRLVSVSGLRDAGADRNEPTYAADDPKARIDVILHSPDLALHRTVVIESQASDHYPLLADFGPA